MQSSITNRPQYSKPDDFPTRYWGERPLLEVLIQVPISLIGNGHWHAVWRKSQRLYRIPNIDLLVWSGLTDSNSTFL
jgi:hypothetical protein